MVVHGTVDPVFENPPVDAGGAVERCGRGQALELVVERVGYDVGGEYKGVSLARHNQFSEKTRMQREGRVGFEGKLSLDSGFRFAVPAPHVNGGAKLVHPGGAKLVHLTLCGMRCWGVVPVVHRRDPRCFV